MGFGPHDQLTKIFSTSSTTKQGVRYLYDNKPNPEMKTVYHDFGSKQITQHDAEIIALLCMGLDRHNMALLLGNEVGTLKNEMTKLYLKTGTTKCTELVAKALGLGFDSKGNWNGVSFLPKPPKPIDPLTDGSTPDSPPAS